MTQPGARDFLKRTAADLERTAADLNALLLRAVHFTHMMHQARGILVIRSGPAAPLWIYSGLRRKSYPDPEMLSKLVMEPRRRDLAFVTVHPWSSVMPRRRNERPTSHWPDAIVEVCEESKAHC
jgi:hypothetical protein